MRGTRMRGRWGISSRNMAEEDEADGRERRGMLGCMCLRLIGRGVGLGYRPGHPRTLLVVSRERRARGMTGLIVITVNK